MKNHMTHICIDARIRFGKPCVRGTRIAVAEVLEFLASGRSEADLLGDFPQLTHTDILACMSFAAVRGRSQQVAE